MMEPGRPLNGGPPPLRGRGNGCGPSVKTSRQIDRLRPLSREQSEAGEGQGGGA
jgi:hypothetical protein